MKVFEGPGVSGFRRRWSRVAIIALALVTLGWLTVRHGQRSVAGSGALSGPAQIIMSQRLTEAVPARLAELPRTQMLDEEMARTWMALLDGGPWPLLKVLGARFGDQGELTLGVGDALSVAAARQIVETWRAQVETWRAQGESHNTASSAPEMAVFHNGARVYLVEAGPEYMGPALAQLRRSQLETVTAAGVTVPIDRTGVRK